MGGALCRGRRSSGGSDPAATRRASSGVDGLYRKIVLNFAKQWTSYSANKSSPKKRGNNKKPNKNKKKKPTISGPFPVDPDSLEGDKWRYVILTRLDTEPPPERPPRTKRRRSRRESTADRGRGGGSGRWGSGRRRRRRRQQQQLQRTPTHADRRVCVSDGPTAAELMELVMDAYRRRSAAGAAPRTTPEPGGGAAAAEPQRPPTRPTPVTVVKKRCPWNRGTGLFGSVRRVGAMVNGLLQL